MIYITVAISQDIYTKNKLKRNKSKRHNAVRFDSSFFNQTECLILYLIKKQIINLWIFVLTNFNFAEKGCDACHFENKIEKVLNKTILRC